MACTFIENLPDARHWVKFFAQSPYLIFVATLRGWYHVLMGKGTETWRINLLKVTELESGRICK